MDGFEKHWRLSVSYKKGWGFIGISIAISSFRS